MRLIKQRSRASCLITSAAMCLNITLDEAIKVVGHDGTCKMWDLPEPTCYIGHHISEITYLCWTQCHSCTMFARDLYSKPGMGSGCVVKIQSPYDFDSFISDEIGILTGCGHGHGHAVAWDGSRVYCPSRGIIDYKNHYDLFFLIKMC